MTGRYGTEAAAAPGTTAGGARAIETLAGLYEARQRLRALGLRHAGTIQDDHGPAFMALASRSAEAMRHAFGGGATVADWQSYLTDAWQRGVLTLDTLRRRGNDYIEHERAGMPPVLDFAYEPVLDGRALPRPCNYALVRILPPSGVTIDETKRPFMIIDPRAGHGAGIGGFKPESQVGEAFEDGHAVYFVIFRPMPEPGQTLADVTAAEKTFLQEIRRRQPQAPKPVILGNCQGGWATMLLAAAAPEETGPVAINGAPMSYWAGETGKNPMRYTGGLNGGALPALILSDLGNGVFDGANLVSNFENLNPGATKWRKYYALFANVDTEAPRFLAFERWWSGFFFMNEAEIRWIVENLFIGNRLAQGRAFLGDMPVDLKRITSPIIVFSSFGDNITPPQQALNWIPDLYRDEREIKARGQRIIYLVHRNIGHLGIFVSAKIASREHDAITDTMRAAEALPPGLYEMRLDDGADRLHIRFEPRTLADILALDDGREDEEMFATVARLSELAAELYDMILRPSVRAAVTPLSAEALVRSQPLRAERLRFSDHNPLVRAVAPMAERVRATRRPADPANPFLALERIVADHVERSLDLFRDTRDAWNELLFHAIYDTPWMRMIGEGARRGAPPRATSEDLRQLPEVQRALGSIGRGGMPEAVARMLMFLETAGGSIRRSRLERAAHAMAASEAFRGLGEDERAALLHEQSLIVDFEPEKALAALPDLLPDDARRREALDVVLTFAGPLAEMEPAAATLYRELERILEPNAQSGWKASSPIPAAAE